MNRKVDLAEEGHIKSFARDHLEKDMKLTMDKYGFTSIERLQHSVDAITKIEFFYKAISEKKFIQDELINSSVLYQFIVIGEAIQYVDADILKKYSYTWHLPRSFRNYIAHEYFGVNMKQVYKTVKVILPELKRWYKI